MEGIKDELIVSDEEREEIKTFAQNQIRFHKDEGDKVYSNRDGSISLRMLDFKSLILSPKYSYIIFKDFYQKYKKLIHDDKLVLISPELTGSILGAAISSYLFRETGKDVKHFISRIRRKKYGLNNLIEGSPKKEELIGKKIVVIEDFINTGSRVTSCLANLTNEIEASCGELNFSCYSFFRKLGSLEDLQPESFFTDKDFPLGFSEFQLKKRNTGAFYKVVSKNKLRWSVETRTTNNWGVPKSSPLLCEKTRSIFYGTDADGLLSVNIDTGNVNWKTVTTNAKKGIVSVPQFIFNDYIVFGDYGGNLNLVRKDDGFGVFKKKVCAYIGSSPCIIGNDGVAIGLEFETENKTSLILGQQQGAIAEFTFNKDAYLESFSSNKKFSINFPRYQHSTPSYSKEHDLIVTGTNASLLLSIDRRGFMVKDKFIGSPMKSSPALYGNIAVIGSFDGKIYFWDFVGGEMISFTQTEDIVYSNPLIYQDRCYIGTGDGQFFTFNLKEGKVGEVINSFFIGDKIHCEPTIFNEKVYCGASNGFMFKSDLDGNLEGVYAVGERLVCKPAFDKDGNAYILNNLNKLVSFNLGF